MSFRYTNNLVATLKHRLYLEAAHRQLVRCTFTGSCNGIEVTCTAYGSVTAIRMVNQALWEPQYRVSSDAASTSSDAEKKGIDLVKLSASIQAATWQAIHNLRAAKEEVHARALRHNPQLRANADLRDWYAQDANTLYPRPRDALTSLTATPWMQAVRFGLPQPRRFLSQATNAKMTEGVADTVAVLTETDCDAAQIPIGATHPLFTPALLQLEVDANAVAAESTGSRIDAAYVRSEQRKEMGLNEEAFWDRVELIRRSQLAAIPNGVKRGYTEMSSTVRDTSDEKVQLRFTQ